MTTSIIARPAFTAIFFFLMFFALFAPSLAAPVPAPMAVANAPASLMGRTYILKDAPVARAPEPRAVSDESFDKEPLDRAARFMIRTKRNGALKL